MNEKMVQRQVHCQNGMTISYLLTRKPVKNVNLRVKPDGRVLVSANKYVPEDFIDSFIEQKQDFILTALARFEERKVRDKEDFCRKEKLMAKQLDEYQMRVFQEVIDETYQMFRKYDVPYPVLKVRRMTSRWGSCQPQRGIITLNSYLIEAPRSCIEYVAVHEFAHFIYPNHSKQFWDFVAEMMPDWKERKDALSDLGRKL